MTFDDVLSDIRKLIGLELSSIRPGADITLLDVDENRSCILIKTSQGQTRSRPISELQTIWEELLRNEAVHVEGVLHGSGTSRNQPETLFASLPYIEWLKVNNKKHISYVGRNTHAFGTLRQMDGMASAELITKMAETATTKRCVAVVVTQDVGLCVANLQDVHSGTISALDQGIYKYEVETGFYYIVNMQCIGLSQGTYLVLPSRKKHIEPPVQIGTDRFWLKDIGGTQMLIKEI